MLDYAAIDVGKVAAHIHVCARDNNRSNMIVDVVNTKTVAPIFIDELALGSCRQGGKGRGIVVNQ